MLPRGFHSAWSVLEQAKAAGDAGRSWRTRLLNKWRFTEALRCEALDDYR